MQRTEHVSPPADLSSVAAPTRRFLRYRARSGLETAENAHIVNQTSINMNVFKIHSVNSAELSSPAGSENGSKPTGCAAPGCPSVPEHHTATDSRSVVYTARNNYFNLAVACWSSHQSALSSRVQTRKWADPCSDALPSDRKNQLSNPKTTGKNLHQHPRREPEVATTALRGALAPNSVLWALIILNRFTAQRRSLCLEYIIY